MWAPALPGGNRWKKVKNIQKKAPLRCKTESKVTHATGHIISFSIQEGGVNVHFVSVFSFMAYFIDMEDQREIFSSDSKN